MGEPTGTTSERLTTAQLLAVATELDPTITGRRLEFWRNQGLLPHPERTGQEGTRPVWTYPPQAEDQLRALLRLREATKDPNVLRAALWFEGYEISTPRARTAMVDYLHHLRTTVDRELQRRLPTDSDLDQGRWAVIDEVAQVVARKRAGPLPRGGRQRKQDRTRAMAVAMGLALNEPGASDRLDQATALEVERLLGLTPGRTLRVGDAGPWLSGPAAAGLADFAKFGSLPALMEATASAEDAALEAARANARVFLLGLSFTVRLADAFTGRPNVTGMSAILNLVQLPDICIWVTALFTSLGRSPAHAESIAQVLDAMTNLRSLEDQVRTIAAMSDEDRAALLKNLPNLPYRQQAGVKRVVAEFRPPV